MCICVCVFMTVCIHTSFISFAEYDSNDLIRLCLCHKLSNIVYTEVYYRIRIYAVTLLG